MKLCSVALLKRFVELSDCVELGFSIECLLFRCRSRPLVEPPMHFNTAAKFLYFASLMSHLEDILIPLSEYSHTNVLCFFFSDTV